MEKEMNSGSSQGRKRGDSSRSDRSPQKGASRPPAQSSDQWMTDVSSRAEDFEAQLRQFVSQRPVVMMLGAVAVGYIANRALISAMKEAQ